LPAIRTQLEGDGGAIPDLTGATVLFRLLKNDVLIFEKPALIENPPTDGIARYEWDDGDTAAYGTFDAEWIVTYADGREETFPPDRYNRVFIKQRRLATGGSPPTPAPKKYQVWDTVDTVAALKALPTVGLVPAKTFYVVREVNRPARLDGNSGLPEDITGGIYDTADDPTLQWFLF
jgi:hypothetical protein